jgi:hypothetical protein
MTGLLLGIRVPGVDRRELSGFLASSVHQQTSLDRKMSMP